MLLRLLRLISIVLSLLLSLSSCKSRQQVLIDQVNSLIGTLTLLGVATSPLFVQTSNCKRIVHIMTEVL